MATWLVRAKEWYARQPKLLKAGLVLAAGGAAVVGGVFAAPAVGALVSAAGFGVAGGTLTGAAASSAGLAAMGGGSLAAGGFGVAGGTAVVATVAGTAGAVTAAATSSTVTKQGSRLADLGREARETVVEEGEIRFEERS